MSLLFIKGAVCLQRLEKPSPDVWPIYHSGPLPGFFLLKVLLYPDAMKSLCGRRAGTFLLFFLFHLLSVCVVKTTEPDTFNLFVAAATGVAIAVVSKDEASSSACHDGETTDGALPDRHARGGLLHSNTTNYNIQTVHVKVLHPFQSITIQ